MSALYRSEDVDALVQLMGRGMMLCVSHNLKDVALWRFPPHTHHFSGLPDTVKVDYATLLGIFYLHRLKRMERERTNGRLGWEELGLDGINQDYYTLLQ